MIKLSPPQHRIDDPAEWIHPKDPAWDHERVERERVRLVEAALANLPANASAEAKELAEAEAVLKHPVAKWLAGQTHFSTTAKITVPSLLRDGEHTETAVPITEYLTGEPTKWLIRPLGARAYRKAVNASQVEWHVEMVKHGLVRIEQPGEDPIEPERDKAGAITEGWLDWLDAQDRHHITRLGAAIFALCQRKGDDDGKKP